MFSRAKVNQVHKYKMENVSKLPDELWLNIIRFLPREDIFKNVALVNKFFHRLTKDPSLVTKILIDEIYYWHFNAYQDLLDRTAMLKELKFQIEPATH